ncbi:MAG TPA: DUF58 domain-containing protein [Abditibacteriaceae bacterium]|jgi:uncharacterized protein (DUF58 family)
MTQRAALVGIIGCCFYIITLLNGLPEYFSILTWLSVSILVCSAGVALLSLQGLKCDWRVAGALSSEVFDPSPLHDDASDSDSEAEPTGPTIEISLANSGTLSKVNLLLDVRLRHLRSGARMTRRFLIEALPSGAAITSTLTLIELPRGRYEIVELRIIGSDVLGLFRATMRLRTAQSERRTAAENQVAVGPASVSGSRSAALSGIAESGGDEAASNRLGRGEEIRGTRPYVAGDDLRTVHWKSTARLGHLVVKEFHPVARSEAVVIWDGAATAAGSNGATSRSAMPRTTPTPRDDATESALRLTMSLCRTLSERGQPCTLLRLDSQPAGISSQSRASTEFSMASYSGGENAGVSSVQNSFQLRCSEALADATADRETSLAEALGSQLAGVDMGGDVYLVTASLSPDVGHTASLLQRRGSRLAVALVDASQVQSGRAAQETASLTGFTLRAKRDDAAAKATNYAEQTRRLSAVGARVVQLRLGARRMNTSAQSDTQSAGVVHDVRAALSHLLDAHFSGRGFAGRAFSESSEYSEDETAASAADTTNN